MLAMKLLGFSNAQNMLGFHSFFKSIKLNLLALNETLNCNSCCWSNSSIVTSLRLPEAYIQLFRSNDCILQLKTLRNSLLPASIAESPHFCLVLLKLKANGRVT